MMPAPHTTPLAPDPVLPADPSPPLSPRSPDRRRFESAPAPIWLQRLSLVVLVLFCFYIGGLLAILPWSPRYWDRNGWLLAHPALQAVLERGWLRGLVSGMGLLDIWIGISELLHYRDFRDRRVNAFERRAGPKPPQPE
jgi:hypothetical protein